MDSTAHGSLQNMARLGGQIICRCPNCQRPLPATCGQMPRLAPQKPVQGR